MLGPDWADNISGRALGRTLITEGGTPLGFAGVYFDENAQGQCVVIAFFYGGPNNVFMRKYMPLIMRGFRDVCKLLIEMGIATIYAVSDRKIPQSDKFIEWLGGRLLDADAEGGPVYAIELAKIPVISRT